MEFNEHNGPDEIPKIDINEVPDVKERAVLVEDPNHPGTMITKEEYDEIMKERREDPDWYRNQ